MPEDEEAGFQIFSPTSCQSYSQFDPNFRGTRWSSLLYRSPDTHEDELTTCFQRSVACRTVLRGRPHRITLRPDRCPRHPGLRAALAAVDPGVGARPAAGLPTPGLLCAAVHNNASRALGSSAGVVKSQSETECSPRCSKGFWG